jgi:vesicle-associated membrane protein 7
MPFFGGLVLRISDRLVLCRSEGVPDVLGIPSTAWATVVSKCSSPNFRTSGFLDLEEGFGPEVKERPERPRRIGYHISSDDEVAFAVVTDEQTPRRSAHLVLDEVQKIFKKMFVEGTRKLTPKSAEVFGIPLQEMLVRYSDESNVDEKIKKIRKTVDDVKGMALENVEKVLQRGQQIEDIVAVTEDLQAQATGFHSSSRQLRQAMWWNGVKGKLIIGAAALLFIVIVYFIFCGGGCGSNSATKPSS